MQALESEWEYRAAPQTHNPSPQDSTRRLRLSQIWSSGRGSSETYDHTVCHTVHNGISHRDPKERTFKCHQSSSYIMKHHQKPSNVISCCKRSWHINTHHQTSSNINACFPSCFSLFYTKPQQNPLEICWPNQVIETSPEVMAEDLARRRWFTMFHCHVSLPIQWLRFHRGSEVGNHGPTLVNHGSTWKHSWWIIVLGCVGQFLLPIPSRYFPTQSIRNLQK